MHKKIAEMKVLHLIDTTGPGGAQKVLSGILDRFGSGHHAIALRQGRQNVFSEGRQIKVCRTSSAYSIKPFFSVFSYVRKHKPLVLHCHLPKSQLLGILVCKILKKPPLLILHEQGDILDSPRLMKVIYRYFASEVKLIIACSGYLEKKIAGLRPEFEPITRVIPNFVDNSFFLNSQHYKPVEEKNLPFNIGFAGRLVRRKGWQSLVSFIHSSQHDFHFWIAGDGPDKKRLLKELKKIPIARKSLSIPSWIMYLICNHTFKSLIAWLFCHYGKVFRLFCWRHWPQRCLLSY